MKHSVFSTVSSVGNRVLFDYGQHRHSICKPLYADLSSGGTHSVPKFIPILTNIEYSHSLRCRFTDTYAGKIDFFLAISHIEFKLQWVSILDYINIDFILFLSRSVIYAYVVTRFWKLFFTSLELLWRVWIRSRLSHFWLHFSARVSVLKLALKMKFWKRTANQRKNIFFQVSRTVWQSADGTKSYVYSLVKLIKLYKYEIFTFYKTVS